jgi:hypothetical protein
MFHDDKDFVLTLAFKMNRTYRQNTLFVFFTLDLQNFYYFSYLLFRKELNTLEFIYFI